MAGATLCVSCASLPFKDRASAVKFTQCPQCGAAFGVTAYGAAFRVLPRKPMRLSTTFVGGAIIGAALFVFVVVLTVLGVWSREAVVGPNARPAAPVVADDLTRVPEVAVADAFPANVQPDVAKRRIANLVNQIKTENARQQDAFVLANMKARPELAGLPFVMGADCRLDMNRAQSFQSSVEAVRDGLERDARSHQQEHTPFWNTYLQETNQQGIDTDHGVAALTQILGPESKTMRTSLVRRLKLSNNPAALKTIARAAVFDADGDVRMAALQALKEEKKTREPAVTEALLAGIRYPLATVAKRSARAIINLERKDLLPTLVAALADPAPSDPVTGEDGTTTVREVVKINHHRNCLLCHPPVQTGQEQEVPGVIPIPGMPFSTSPKEAYGRASQSNDPMVRADTTYLRQDFSVMMAVANAAPWPEMQRFDFIVRKRVVEGKELAQLQEKVQGRPAGFLSENHKAILTALTELSGERNVAPNQAAWQRVIGGRNDE